MSVIISYLQTNTNSQRAVRFFLCTTAAELPTTTPAADGDKGYAKDTDSLYSFDGTSWNLHTTQAQARTLGSFRI
jgi:hypothetical protein